MNVRQSRRYVFADPFHPPFEIRSGDNRLGVTDISASGLKYNGFYDSGLTLHLRSAAVVGPGGDGAVTNIEHDLPNAGRRVIRFVSPLDWLLGPLVAAGEVEPANTRHDGFPPEAYAIFDQTVDKCPEIRRRHVLDWFCANQFEGPALRAAMLLVEQALGRYYFSKSEFAEYLERIVKQVDVVARWAAVDWVPMRMPKRLSEILDVAKLLPLNHHWHGSLFEFVNGGASGVAADDGPRCLVALDSFANRGTTRQRFLWLLEQFPNVARAYHVVYLAAVVGHDSADVVRSELALPSSRNARHPDVRVLTAHRLTDSDRPPSCFGPQPEAIAAELARQLRAPSFEVGEPTVVSFFYACPFASVPILWSERDDHIPLLRPFEYYSPAYRPHARAPMFDAYHGTLEELINRIRRGGPVPAVRADWKR